MTDREAFLAGDRPDEVCVYLHETAVSSVDALAGRGERTDEGVVLVTPGETGRQAFQSVAGIDPMAFARTAMETDGEIRRDLTGGTCPARENGDGTGGHETRLIFAFAQSRTEEAGGLYAEGDVIHAYAACECGQRYSEKWLAGD
ncbi:MAG: DUF5807 family protein [Salinirussus sp.]